MSSDWLSILESALGTILSEIPEVGSLVSFGFTTLISLLFPDDGPSIYDVLHEFHDTLLREVDSKIRDTMQSLFTTQLQGINNVMSEYKQALKNWNNEPNNTKLQEELRIQFDITKAAMVQWLPSFLRQGYDDQSYFITLAAILFSMLAVHLRDGIIMGKQWGFDDATIESNKQDLYNYTDLMLTQARQCDFINKYSPAETEFYSGIYIRFYGTFKAMIGTGYIAYSTKYLDNKAVKFIETPDFAIDGDIVYVSSIEKMNWSSGEGDASGALTFTENNNVNLIKSSGMGMYFGCIPTTAIVRDPFPSCSLSSIPFLMTPIPYCTINLVSNAKGTLSIVLPYKETYYESNQLYLQVGMNDGALVDPNYGTIDVLQKKTMTWSFQVEEGMCIKLKFQCYVGSPTNGDHKGASIPFNNRCRIDGVNDIMFRISS